jgi:SlyX protein
MECSATEIRLNELEAKLSFSEDLIETLNETVFRQQEQLNLIQQQLQLLHQQVQSVLPDEVRDLRQDIPPHY